MRRWRARRWIVATTAAMTMFGWSVGVPPASAALTVDWLANAGIELGSVARIGDDAVVTGSVDLAGARHPALLVRRYRGDGELAWSRTWRPQGTRVDGLDVDTDADGAVYVVGDIARANLEGGGSFVRKYGPTGDLRWSRISEGGFVSGPDVPEVATGVSVHGTVVIVVGHGYECCGGAGDDGWIRAFTTNGRTLWERNFEVPDVDRRTNDVALEVATDDRGAYIVGHVETTRRVDAAVRVDTELVVQRVRFSGERVWTWVLRDRDVKDFDLATDVAVDRGGVFVVGDVNGRRFPRGQGFVAQLPRRDGDLVWKRTWGVPADGIEPAGVTVTGAGTLVIAGMQADADDRTIDQFLRRIEGTDGSLIEQAVNDRARDIGATAVTVAGAGAAFVSGWVAVGDDEHAGRLWRWTF